MASTKRAGMHITILTFMACTVALLYLFPVAEATNYTVGLLIPMRVAYFTMKGIYYASAFSIAVDEINKQDNLLPGNNISFIWNDTVCDDENKTIRALMYQMYEMKVSAIIGPGCNCNTSARNAAAFNVPMISYVSTRFCSASHFILMCVNIKAEYLITVSFSRAQFRPGFLRNKLTCA